jgi:hypothetical protein
VSAEECYFSLRRELTTAGIVVWGVEVMVVFMVFVVFVVFVVMRWFDSSPSGGRWDEYASRVALSVFYWTLFLLSLSLRRKMLGSG